MPRNLFSLLVACLFFCATAVAQHLNDYDAPTDVHVGITGTEVFMIPPSGFQQSTQFKGFQNPSDPTSMIMVMEIPGPYAEVTAGFTEEALQSKNMTLVEKQDIKLAEYDGMVISIDQQAGGRLFSKWLLVYGDAGKTAMINAVWMKDSVALGEQMKASVWSTVLNRKTTADPRESLDFTVDGSKGNLVYSTVVGNGMVFTRDGKLPAKLPDKVALIAEKSYARVDVGDRKQFCIDRFKKYPDAMEIPDPKALKSVKIDGLDGYQAVSDNLDKPGEAMLQVILFPEEGGYYLLVGMHRKDDKKALKDLKAVVQTFKRKG